MFETDSLFEILFCRLRLTIETPNRYYHCADGGGFFQTGAGFLLNNSPRRRPNPGSKGFRLASGR